MLKIVLWAVLLAAVQAANETCTHGKGEWLHSEEARAVADDRTPFEPTRVVINLDLAPEERWLEVATKYKDQAYKLIGYIESFVPKWAMPIVAEVAGEIDKYKGFGEYAGEMKGIAKGMGVPLGDVVIANLIYQLESLGVNCSNWNNTGPTGECINKTGVIYPFKRPSQSPGPNGFCTSIVAEDKTGKIVHGRNLDWNLDATLRPFIIDASFQRGGKTVYKGNGIMTFTGLLNGMRPDGFTYSMDARCQGGKLLANFLEALKEGGATPAQYGRTVLEKASTYDEAVDMFSRNPLVDDIYYIVGGVRSGEGAIITRDREKAVDVWSLDKSPTGWFRLETNYDRWIAVPSSDDRRGPGMKNMEKMGQEGLTNANMLQVMLQWPTFNHHTDFTSVMSAKDGSYESMYWM